MKKHSIACFVFAVFFCVAATAQNLAPAALTPVADGTVGSGEYSVTGTYSGIQLFSSLSADGKTVYLALTAPASGWVSIGVGSTRMDKAYIIMAYDAGGKTAITEQTGFWHSHKQSDATKLLSSAVLEADGKTTLEISLPAAGSVSKNELPLILAYGDKDDFVSMHRKFAMVKLPIQQ